MTKIIDLHGAEMALLFRQAAQIVQARGHGKGLYVQPTGEVCAVGALLVASGRNPEDGMAESLEPTGATWFLSSRITSNTKDADPVERIADWNDQPERTATEVVEALMDAARAIEEREASAILPVSLRASDGSVWDLASIPADGGPRYVLAGYDDVLSVPFAEYSELINLFGAVPVAHEAVAA